MSTVTGAFYKMYYTTPLNPKKSKTWTQIKVKKPGDLGENLEIYQQHQKELKPSVGNT